MMRLRTARQPVEFKLNVLTMSHEEILNLISATHVSADDNFDVDSLFVDVKKIFQRTFAIFDKLLLGQQYREIPEEKVSTANFDPVLLCTLKELSSEMACKTQSVEIVHKTTMSILNKLSSYSWVAKAVLTLAASALVYEDFLSPAHLHSSIQRVESMEIPEHAPAALTLLNLQKYKETISKLNRIIHGLMNFVTEHICELNKLCNNYMKDEPSLLSYVVDDIPVAVYWTIINVVACTTHMCCLSSAEDKTQELIPLVRKAHDIRYHLGSCINNCNERIEKAQTRKMKELLQTPDESMEVFKALIFAKDDMQPLIDGSTNEMVNINVLEKKYVLLFISSLEISNDDISILMGTFMENSRCKRGYDYKIVWIPIVEQWSDGLRKKFEMLRSKMPWYVVQYFSPVARIKFIKEEWHFEYKPIVVVINPQGHVINDNAIDMIRLNGTFKRRAYPALAGPIRFSCLQRQGGHMICSPPGPYALEEYTFLCGGKDNEWIKQFSEKVNVVAEDPITKDAYISIKLSCNGEGRKQWRCKQWHFWKLRKTRKIPDSDPGSQEIQKLLLSLKNESRWAVLTKSSTRVVSHHGSTIMKVLEAFEEWKVNVPEKGFEICFKEFHDKFLQTGSLPLTPSPVEGS